jgi:hypothetical protein
MRITRVTSVTSGLALFAAVNAQRALAACSLDGGAAAGADCAQGSSTTTDLMGSIGTITNTLIIAIGIISVIMIVIGGLRYVLSGGDQKGTTAAKDTILYAVIGMVVALLAYSIANFVIGIV